MRSLICLVLAAALLGGPALAQEAAAAQTTTPSEKKEAQKPAVVEPQPLPYAPDEFSPWLRDLRRGEIIAIGAFPIVYVFTQFGYNLYRYGVHGWDSQYAPLGNPNRAAYSESETIGVLLGAASVSILIATADYLIGRRRRTAGGNP